MFDSFAFQRVGTYAMAKTGYLTLLKQNQVWWDLTGIMLGFTMPFLAFIAVVSTGWLAEVVIFHTAFSAPHYTIVCNWRIFYFTAILHTELLLLALRNFCYSQINSQYPCGTIKRNNLY